MTGKKLLMTMLSGAALCGLAACDHPNAMPTGYTYHHELYKSPAPPMPRVITDAQRKYMDETQAEQFRDATYILLERLTQRAGMPPKPVYVMAPTPMTNFYANIDHTLRENMRHIGYALSDTPEGAYIFTYDAMLLDPTVSNGNNVELVLRVFNTMGENARMLSAETGQYYIQGAETLRIKPTGYADRLGAETRPMALPTYTYTNEDSGLTPMTP
jgi:hypothetical protein